MEEKGLEIAELVMTWFARTADTPMRCTYCVSFVYWSAFVPHLRKMYFFLCIHILLNTQGTGTVKADQQAPCLSS